MQGAPSVAQKALAFQQAFWKFLRPHTIRGTILGSCAVTAKAVLENPQACLQLATLIMFLSCVYTFCHPAYPSAKYTCHHIGTMSHVRRQQYHELAPNRQEIQVAKLWTFACSL